MIGLRYFKMRGMLAIFNHNLKTVFKSAGPLPRESSARLLKVILTSWLWP